MAQKKAVAKSVVLTPAERTTVLALASQRQLIMNEANKQLAGLDGAMKDLQALYVQKYSVEGDTFRFRQEGEHLILEAVADEVSDGDDEK